MITTSRPCHHSYGEGRDYDDDSYIHARPQRLSRRRTRAAVVAPLEAAVRLSYRDQLAAIEDIEERAAEGG